ncbi:hypothetical protein D1818_01150 [Aquimarina sp. BL5]|uniref:DoxX family protein n=1 Tax=Aquimarina sp. BL5 TaxID=1714860 RepID=UPI000E4907B9|nr:MauE/DoxX family redox-associated membrane protein [Aquimarina sp. BL5]AXT49493.1 hypothetical protein D1818_01150 [Aquimarina sp. BL5]RKN04389.1 hypothetical protein D7036_12395 [Aquimarina sp. BL5]
MGIKQLLLYLLSAFFLIAGLNHFIHPAFYLPLIPKYLIYPEYINHISGIAEILLSIMLLFTATRKTAAYLIILLLLAFIPSHIYFIVIGSCVKDGLCVPEWVAWCRLILIHPILIWWAWCVRK